MDKSDYLNKLNLIVSDISKFQKLDVDDIFSCVLKTENSLKYYINKYVKPKLSADSLVSILPKGSQPGRLYGLPKIHKNNCPLRPVVSMTNCAQYNLAQFLNKIIIPHIPKDLWVSSSTEFLNKLKSFNSPDKFNFFSLDVTSLFTNIPLNETINLAAELVYNSESPPLFDVCFYKTSQICYFR